MIAQDSRNAVKQEFLNLWQCHVQGFLLTAKDLIFATQSPIGVGTVDVAVLVDHLCLKPDAEGHALGMHMIDQRLQAFWIFARVYFPIREGHRVIVTIAEPAII